MPKKTLRNTRAASVLRLVPALIFLLSLFLAVPPAAAQHQLADDQGRKVTLADGREGFYRYHNARFSYSIEIPKIFEKVLVMPENGDGLILATADERASFTVYASNNVLGEDLRMAYDQALDEMSGLLAESELGPNYYQLTWIDGPDHYFRRVVHEGGQVRVFDLKCPMAEINDFLPLIEWSAQSFTSGN